MKFYEVPYRNRRPPSDASYPCCVFFKDGWNDFGVYNLYYFYYWLDKDTELDLGGVKILQLQEDDTISSRTEIPKEFDYLGEEYCSLGQGQTYYSTLLSVGRAPEVLTALRDVILNPEIGSRFKDHRTFEKSLLRFSEARSIFEMGYSEISPPYYGNEKTPDLAFKFTTNIRGFDAPHTVAFSFEPLGNLPHRIMVLVGRNGTGKTAVLAELATAMSGITENLTSSFEPKIPDFIRTVVISYSPFGPFKFPPISTSSYRFCGLLGKEGDLLSNEDLRLRVVQNLEQINTDDARRALWIEVLNIIGIAKNEPSLATIQDTDSGEEIFDVLSRFSSGHFYVCAVATELLANLTQRSILLFDEPELYLHPNILSGLMRALDRILSDPSIDSYAVAATHSPIVLQEIPRRSVRVIGRDGDTPICASLDFECFGDNLANIVNQVFGVTIHDKNYMSILSSMKANLSLEEIDGLFDKKLSINAKVYLAALEEED